MTEQKLKHVQLPPGTRGGERRRKESERDVVTAAIINHDGMAVLPGTLSSLRAVEETPLTLFLLDDASRDGSPDWVETHYPEIEVVRLPAPGGRPSRLRNRALRSATSRYVLLIDNDVALEPGCVRHLMVAMRSGSRVLAATPTLVYASNPNTIYRQGNDIHYLCIATDATLDQPRQLDDEVGSPFPTLPGGNALVDREAAVLLGLFDEAYDFGWGEDSELYARGAFEGWTSVLAPAAVARHVERPEGVVRGEAQLYNRYRFILTHYSRRALALLAPPLLIFEVMLVAMCLARGMLPEYGRALWRTVRNGSEIMERRRTLQGRPRQRASDVLVGKDFFPAGQRASSRIVRAASRAANAFFAGYWSLVRRWL